jgi:hypothetical protein
VPISFIHNLLSPPKTVCPIGSISDFQVIVEYSHLAMDIQANDETLDDSEFIPVVVQQPDVQQDLSALYSL